MEDIALKIPVDRTAAIVTGKGIHYTPIIQKDSVISKVPIPTRQIPESTLNTSAFTDLTGRQIGSFKVIGLSKYQKKRWVVKCVCGNYTARRSKSLLNESTRHMCDECNHLQRIKWLYANQ